MRLVSLRGVRGGVGTTSIVAGLGWALRQLGARVLLVDFCRSNDLRLFFDVAVSETCGWARAKLDDRDWRGEALRYADGIDILPFGTVRRDEMSRVPASSVGEIMQAVAAGSRDGWALFDMPDEQGDVPDPGACDICVSVARPDMRCYLSAVEGARDHEHMLINAMRVESRLHQACHILFDGGGLNLLPLAIHHDESMAESMASKQPVGVSAPTSLAASELLWLGNWLLSRRK